MNQPTLRLDRNIQRGRELHFHMDGEELIAYEGETIAAALSAAGRRVFRHTANGAPRGMFCGIGICFDCLVNVNGRNVRACVTPVSEGMMVSASPVTWKSQDGG